jgi:hypothetical protein
MAVIRHLRIIGGDRSVTALAPKLLDANIADHALYALEKIPGNAACPSSLVVNATGLLGKRLYL